LCELKFSSVGLSQCDYIRTLSVGTWPVRPGAGRLK
jgi:hypothetical protein